MRHYKNLTKEGQARLGLRGYKRVKMDLILLGAWKLIERKDDYSVCEQCAQCTGQESMS